MRKTKAKWLHEELKLAADSFQKQAAIHQKFAGEHEDHDYIRGWHEGTSQTYYDAMCDVRGWEQDCQREKWNDIRIGLACVVSNFERRITRHTDPTNNEFDRGYISAQSVKSQELLLLLNNWQRTLSPRR